MKGITFIDRKTGAEITENPPGEAALKFLYHNPFGKLALHAIVKRKFLSAWYGRLMNKANSTRRIQAFVDQLNIDMTESIENVDSFDSFNDFFYRKLKDSARPINEGFVSPGDGKLIAFENVSDLANFFVKGNEFSLNEFLQSNALAKEFENSSLIILRLAPNDYHRFHFPFPGSVSESKQIKGNYYSVSPYALAYNFARVFCENKRSYTILNTETKGRILISPVGATMVGSIIDTFEPFSDVKKGDEMGYFAFGGSTVLMLVAKDKITIDADLLANTKEQKETAVKMGERIGI